jgi:hypothetical protein
LSNEKLRARKEKMREIARTATPEALRKSEEKDKKREDRKNAAKRMKKVKQ